MRIRLKDSFLTVENVFSKKNSFERLACAENSISQDLV
jgi:hypothetical protein